MRNRGTEAVSGEGKLKGSRTINHINSYEGQEMSEKSHLLPSA